MLVILDQNSNRVFLDEDRLSSVDPNDFQAITDYFVSHGNRLSKKYSVIDEDSETDQGLAFDNEGRIFFFTEREQGDIFIADRKFIRGDVKDIEIFDIEKPGYNRTFMFLTKSHRIFLLFVNQKGGIDNWNYQEQEITEKIDPSIVSLYYNDSGLVLIKENGSVILERKIAQLYWGNETSQFPSKKVNIGSYIVPRYENPPRGGQQDDLLDVFLDLVSLNTLSDVKKIVVSLNVILLHKNGNITIGKSENGKIVHHSVKRLPFQINNLFPLGWHQGEWSSIVTDVSDKYYLVKWYNNFETVHYVAIAWPRDWRIVTD